MEQHNRILLIENFKTTNETINKLYQELGWYEKCQFFYIFTELLEFNTDLNKDELFESFKLIFLIQEKNIKYQGNFTSLIVAIDGTEIVVLKIRWSYNLKQILKALDIDGNIKKNDLKKIINDSEGLIKFEGDDGLCEII